MSGHQSSHADDSDINSRRMDGRLVSIAWERLVRHIVRWLCVAAVCSLGIAGPALAGKRVALVVGVSKYASGGELKQAPLDAQKIHKALGAAGFTDMPPALINPTKAQLDSAILDFNLRSRGADVAVFYFAGHGMTFGDDSWIIPSDALLRADDHILAEGVQLRNIIRYMGPAHLRLIILDACRNNPFVINWGGQRSSADGLARVPEELLPVGTGIAFSAAPGEKTPDNGVYANALATAIGMQGMELTQVMRRVSTIVRETDPRADPTFIPKYEGAFMFHPPDAGAAISSPAVTTGGTSLNADAAMFLKVTGAGVAGASACAGYRDYKAAFPNGAYTGQINQLLSSPPCGAPVTVAAAPLLSPEGLQFCRRIDRLRADLRAGRIPAKDRFGSNYDFKFLGTDILGRGQMTGYAFGLSQDGGVYIDVIFPNITTSEVGSWITGCFQLFLSEAGSAPADQKVYEKRTAIGFGFPVGTKVFEVEAGKLRNEHVAAEGRYVSGATVRIIYEKG